VPGVLTAPSLALPGPPHRVVSGFSRFLPQMPPRCRCRHLALYWGAAGGGAEIGAVLRQHGLDADVPDDPRRAIIVRPDAG
jgi:hypothetical protein